MEVFENSCFFNSTFDPETEDSLISLASKLNSFSVNNPELDCSSLIDNVAQLIKTIDSLSGENTELKSKLEDLTCELTILNARFENFQREKRAELNDSLKFQDFVVEEKEAISRDLATYKNNIVQLQSSLAKVTQENEELRATLQYDVTSNPCVNPTNTANNVEPVIADKDMSLKLLSAKLNDVMEERRSMASELEKLQLRLKTIQSDKWLDDSIIQSYFLSLNDCNAATTSKAIFVGPAVSELLKQGPTEVVEQQLSTLGLTSFKYAFFCINNNDKLEWTKNDSTSVGRGSHWSLLFVNIVNKQAYHLDSLDDANLNHALLLSDKLSISRNNFLSVRCQRQNNNFECGLNVILNAKVVLHGFCSNYYSSFLNWYYQFFCSETAGDSDSLHDIQVPPNTNFSSVKAASQPVICEEKKSHTLNLKKVNSKEWEVVKKKKSKKRIRNLKLNLRPYQDPYAPIYL